MSDLGPNMSDEEVRKLAEAEKAQGVVDQQSAGSAAAGAHGAQAAPKRFAEAADEVKAQAKVVADQVVAKAKDAYSQARSVADRGAVQGRDVIVERPYVAVGLALLVGVVLGHAMGASRPTVVYLKDRRPV